MISSSIAIEQPDARPPLPNPRPIETAPFKWRVVTRERLPEGDDWVYYAIAPKDYEVLSRNMADILRWVREARWRMDYYRGEGPIDGQGISGDSGTN